MEESFRAGAVQLELQVEHLVEQGALSDVRVSNAEQISFCNGPLRKVVVAQFMVRQVTVDPPDRVIDSLVVLYEHEGVHRVLQILIEHELLNFFGTDLEQVVEGHLLRSAVPQLILVFGISVEI